MATTNVPGDLKLKTSLRLLCSTDLTAGIHGQLTFISILNLFLSITAFLGNALILVALRKESSLHPPSKLLIRSLATSDLCVGLITGPLCVIFYMSLANEQWNVCRFAIVAASISGSILCLVSLLTLAAISVDRLLALLLGLRYRQVVTLTGTYVIVITFWILSTVFSTMYLRSVLVVQWYTVIMAVLLCLVTSIFSYTKIFVTLCKRQNQVQDQTQQRNQTNQLNIARYRKAVSSALWLQLTLVACYLPVGIVIVLAASSGISATVFLAYQYAIQLLFLNSSINPILYCWKLGEVRQAAKYTLRQVLCCLSS